MPRIQDAQPEPMVSEFHLPLRSTQHPLGFPVELATNSADIVAAAHDVWGSFKQSFFEKPVQLNVAVFQRHREHRLRVPSIGWRGHLLTIVGGQSNFACCDMHQGFGFACLTSATASDHSYSRYHFLESMAYTMLQSLYLTPIHAACVALNGRGILLCGDSKAGKSSLAYACASRGWTHVSDNASYLVRSANENVAIGNPYRIRLRASASQLFPELCAHPITLRAQGERSIEVETANRTDLITAQHSAVDHVIFLDRQPVGSPKLSPFPKERALRWFENLLCLGDSNVRAAQKASLHRLLRADVLQFRYSQLDPAVTALKELVALRFLPVRHNHDGSSIAEPENA